jgi:hypothetical protein
MSKNIGGVHRQIKGGAAFHAEETAQAKEQKLHS